MRHQLPVIHVTCGLNKKKVPIDHEHYRDIDNTPARIDPPASSCIWMQEDFAQSATPRGSTEPFERVSQPHICTMSSA